MRRRRLLCASSIALCLILAPAVTLAAASDGRAPTTFARAGEQALQTLVDVFYAGHGLWRECNRLDCLPTNSDWGADAATYALYLRWKTVPDPRIKTVVRALESTAPLYPAPCAAPQGCSSWSDTVEWDALALMREYEVSGDPSALVRAEDAYRFVARSHAYALGACPSIPYQQPHTGAEDLKTLETTSNALKTAILLYRATHDAAYLRSAQSQYAAVRTYFLDPGVPLYTIHLIDDGKRCAQVPRRFFASVNGNMIWSGMALSELTGDREYSDDAIATAKAVAVDLSDDRGVFADLAGDNDVVEPLVEAMFDLATRQHAEFARAWILRNAAAALSARAQDGTFSRYFDGPPQVATSIWASNGGLALEIAASALDPNGRVSVTDRWNDAAFDDLSILSLPARLTFDGSGVALVGTFGKQCEASHVRIFIDGSEVFDRAGLWQNKSMPDGHDATVLFAWRWPQSGSHTIVLEPGGATGMATADVGAFVLPSAAGELGSEVQRN
jgi:hypothetical protein